MKNVNNTLYIPLYGKALVSKQGIILNDKKAEYIWEKEQFPLKNKSKSKYLAYYMGMRSAVFDDWCKTQMNLHKDAIILHLGCGMDSRCERIYNTTHHWYDIDFESVIEERKKYYNESSFYHMVKADLRNFDFSSYFPGNKEAIILMEGISMYFTNEELHNVYKQISSTFENVYILMDVYSNFAAKASKYKNPINDVGVQIVYGMDDPTYLEKETSINYIKEHDMTPAHYISHLPKKEQKLFSSLYAGSFSRKLYHLYEYKK